MKPAMVKALLDKKRGFTILEMMVALALSGIIISSILLVFRSEHRTWLNRQDESEGRMILQGSLQEFSRTIRSTGGWLTAPMGGVVSYKYDSAHFMLVTNSAGVRRQTTATAKSDKIAKTITVNLDSAEGFTTTGYALVYAKYPTTVGGVTPPPSYAVLIPKLVVLPVKTVSTSPARIVLGVDSLLNWGLWNFANAIWIDSATQIMPLDTIEYRLSQDTLYRRISRAGSGPLCDLVDQMKVSYLQPGGVWATTVQASNTQTQFDAMRIELHVKTRNSDPTSARLTGDGHKYFQATQEFSLRNATKLTNVEHP